MTKRALGLLICMMLVACSKAPGAKDTGYRGIPWGADAGTVAKTLGVPSHTAGASALFASHYQATAPKLGALLEKGFANFLAGNSGANPGSLDALKGVTVLDAGKKGYSLFFNGKFGMNVRPIPASEYPADHDRLMKRYGVIDKKVDYMPDEHQSAYFIMWHDADGKILLAKEVYQAAPGHQVTACQIIHIDKRVFNAISGVARSSGSDHANHLSFRGYFVKRPSQDGLEASFRAQNRAAYTDRDEARGRGATASPASLKERKYRPKTAF